MHFVFLFRHTLGVSLVGADKVGRPDDDRIVYATGRDVIVFDEDTRQCHYMKRATTNIITSLCVSAVAATKKSYVAVADRADGHAPQVCNAIHIRMLFLPRCWRV